MAAARDHEDVSCGVLGGAGLEFHGLLDLSVKFVVEMPNYSTNARACLGALPLLNSTTPGVECSRTIQFVVMGVGSWLRAKCKIEGVAELGKPGSSEMKKRELHGITPSCHRQVMLGGTGSSASRNILWSHLYSPHCHGNPSRRHGNRPPPPLPAGLRPLSSAAAMTRDPLL